MENVKRRSGLLANWAEVVETVVILASMVLLIQEVRDNTKALQLQAYMGRGEAHVRPYFEVEGFSDVYAKVKAVDREFPEGPVVAFQERYDMTQEEALLWVRHLDDIWRNFEGNFLYGGDREILARDMSHLLTFPDQQLYFRSVGAGLNPEFRVFLEGIQSGPAQQAAGAEAASPDP